MTAPAPRPLEKTASKCASCGAANPEAARFCNQCAAAISASAYPVEHGGETERRQMTVMFADLVNSTGLAQSLDTEDFSDLIREYWAICDEVVAELGGRVSQHLGDGVMAYFGHPKAQEDDPRRATEAALRIVDRTRVLNDRLQLERRISPEVRVGIHTGVVVIGRAGLALGETPNLAARLEQLAQPNWITISDATRKLIEGYFHLESLGRQNIKGFAEPLEVHRVLGLTAAQTRIDATISRLTPFVGRDREADQLAGLWAASIAGRSPGLVVVTGDSGIGKSRLVQTFKDSVAGKCLVLEGYCSELRQNAVLRPIAQALEMAAGLGSRTDPQARMGQLARFVEGLEVEPDTAALLAPVLALPVPDGSPTAGLTPGVRRQRTMSALLAFFHALAKKRPVLLTIEDLQWADASTMEFLDAYANAAREPMMVLGTARPEPDPETGKVEVEVEAKFEPSPRWPQSSFAIIGLEPLSHEQAERLIDSVPQGHTLDRAVRDRIVSMADGNPLHIEEVTKSTLETLALRPDGQTGGRTANEPAVLIPPTVQDSLEARLDRLGRGKAVVQLAAILGREFPYDVLRAVGLMDDAELKTGLRQLAESGLLFAEERGGLQLYRFRHAMIHEAAYQSLLKSRRRQYHHRAASVLLDLFPEMSDAQPDVIAQHYSKANLPKLASTYFERAGAAAFSAQAYVESTSHLRSALEHIEKLPTGKDRDSRELNALAALGLPLLMTKGYAAPDVEVTYERAMNLTTETNPPVRILFGVWGAQLVRGSLLNTERMVGQFRRIAEKSRNPNERLISLAAVGSHAFWRGDLERAITDLKAAVAEFEPEMLAVLPRDYGYDNAVYPHLYLAWAQQISGQLAEAKATWDTAWAITEATKSPYLLALALSFGGAMARDLGERSKALEMSARAMALSSEHQLAFWEALAKMQHGSAQCLDGRLGEGTALIEQGLGFCKYIGIMTPLSYYLAYLADAYWRAGATQKGLETVDEGLEIAETHVDRSSLTELLWLKGELVLQGNGSLEVAADHFRRSLAIARSRGAGLWELRSATALARLLGKTGQPAQALEVLDAALCRLGPGRPPVVETAHQLRAEIAG